MLLHSTGARDVITLRSSTRSCSLHHAETRLTSKGKVYIRIGMITRLALFLVSSSSGLCVAYALWDCYLLDKVEVLVSVRDRTSNCSCSDLPSTLTKRHVDDWHSTKRPRWLAVVQRVFLLQASCNEEDKGDLLQDSPHGQHAHYSHHIGSAVDILCTQSSLSLIDFSGFLSIYWGALWKTFAAVHKLEGWIIVRLSPYR